MNQRLNVTLLGHKDHGKSTLIGRLLYDTGSAKADRVEEVREISRGLGKPFEYAFLLDSFEEERAGGMTIDVIHAQIQGRRHLYDCIDVPGHKELIKNMLTGASNADAGILIVSVKEGIEEQTGRHLRLAQWLGLGQLIVAVNKMDAAGYRAPAFEAIWDEIAALAGPELGARLVPIPVSAYEGDNVVARSPRMPWYTGPTLFERMEGLEAREDLSRLPLRLPVQGLYPGGDGRRIIAGRIESGALRVGQRVRFAPSGLEARVSSIHASGRGVETAAAGENVGFVCEPDPGAVRRGEVCCGAEQAAAARSEATGHAILLDSATRRITVECGTAETTCEIECLSPPEPGEVTPVAFRFATPLVVERSRTAIGRLALKRQGKIIGVAVVT